MLFKPLVRFFYRPQDGLVSGLGVTGCAFAIARFTQLGSAVFLTRMLTPADFAILAVITAIQAFSAQVTSLNLGAELVRASKLDSRDVEVAWTYEFFRNLTLWAILFFPANFWAGTLNHPDAAEALRISSCGLLIYALRNPYSVRIRRDKLFALLGVIDVIPAFVLAFCSVLLVVWTDHYMGIVYAGIASCLASTCCSYFAFPALPRLRFSLQRAAPMLRFGGKLFTTSIFSSFEANFPIFIVASLGQPQDVGYLNRAYAFSVAIALSLTGVIWRVCYPHYAQLSVAGNPPLSHALRASFLILTGGLLAAGLGSLFAPYIIATVLGEQWRVISGFWSLLLLSSAISVAASPLESALHATHNETVTLIIYCCGALLAVVLYWSLYPMLGLVGIGVGSITASACILVGYIVLARVLSRHVP